MKVLKEGKHKTWTAEVTCGSKKVAGCGAVLLAEPEDIVWFCREGYDWTGDSNGPDLRGIECPFCKRHLEVEGAPLPIRRSR
mgnify:CR=1 FL=1